MREANLDWLTSKTQWERSVMKKHARMARILAIGAFIGTMVCDSGYVMMPFIGYTPRVLNNVTDTGIANGRFFPIQVSFPFDAMSSPIFEVMYFLNGIACFICGICIVAPDMVFGVLILHASAQFEILGQKMLHVFDDFEDNRSQDKKLIETRLKEIVATHVRLGR
ncbi:hypothetical protein QAD02_010166 [Eretmocerus hayati]|uniref:Uncharacterized protein n=1 Tax=Eretmocerus hayati TaxID=131215 RepID=A0ACC2NC18_9HYME|nr:hypothetical protein QAD02_010166 [Eretmocerus hayati]